MKNNVFALILLMLVEASGELELSVRAQTAQPIPVGGQFQYPYDMTGILWNYHWEGSDLIRQQGSGVVVKNPKVIVSCAHVVFVQNSLNPWLLYNSWFPAWNTSVGPWTESVQPPLRGYWYFSDYSSEVQNQGQSSGEAFEQDVTVHYSYEYLAHGGAAGYWSSGSPVLTSDRDKLITGYPAGLYSSGDPKQYRMHQTGPFSSSFYSFYENYLQCDGVSTGPGNSGGPVWVADNGQWYFAGVLVSGLAVSLGDQEDLSGVRAVDSDVWQMVDDAIGGTIPPAPVIDEQPQNRTVHTGTRATFSVAAHGFDMHFQWRLNGVDIPGATEWIYTITPVELSNAGTYSVYVSNDGGGVLSDGATLTVILGPPNDNFGDAFELSTATGQTTGNNVNASIEAGEPTPAGIPTSGSVWWRFEPRASGRVSINTLGSDFDTVLSVYKGTNLGSLTAVASNDDSNGGQQSSLAFNARVGNAYYVSVRGFGAAQGQIMLNWRSPGHPRSPFIAIEPTDKTVRAGKPVGFRVVAIGDGRLTFQWHKDGTDIMGATNAVYRIRNAEPSNAGNYSVSVSNSLGSALSVGAQLTVINP